MLAELEQFPPDETLRRALWDRCMKGLIAVERGEGSRIEGDTGARVIVDGA